MRLLLFLILAAVNTKADESVWMTVTLEREQKGEVKVGVYEKHNWLDKRATFNLKIPKGEKSVRIQVPPGIYALAAYVDENGNGKFDQGFLGIPQEPYSFSNSPKVLFSAPSFETCQVKLAEETKIELDF